MKKNYRKTRTAVRSSGSAGLGPGKTVDVEVSALAYGGYGVAKGQFGVVFVHRGVPGDKGRVIITRGKKKYGSGSFQNITEKSGQRTDPGCRAFDEGCGGCQWLHMKYKLQTEWKERIIRETLKRIGKISVKVNPLTAAESQFNNRNKLSLQVQVGKKLCGFMVENSHKIISFDNCRCSMKGCQEAYEDIAESVARSAFPSGVDQVHIRTNRAGEWGVCLYGETSEKKVFAWAKSLEKRNDRCIGVGFLNRNGYRLLCGKPAVKETLNGRTFLIPHDSFFQTNYSQAEVIQDLAADFLAPSKDDKILDIYCGNGFFAVNLAAKCKAVCGIENNELSIKYAGINAAENSLNNVSFMAADAAAGLQALQDKKWSMAVIDPPRAGCDQRVIRQLASLPLKKIAYVSCAPDTLARDIAEFGKYGWKAVYCQPVDMFPNTYHVEIVAGLVKTGQEYIHATNAMMQPAGRTTKI